MGWASQIMSVHAKSVQSPNGVVQSQHVDVACDIINVGTHDIDPDA